MGFQIYVAAAKKGSQGAAAAAKEAPASQMGKGKKGKVGLTPTTLQSGRTDNSSRPFFRFGLFIHRFLLAEKSV